MKVIINTVVLFLALAINLVAQNNSPATIISYKGDTLKGEIEVPSGSWWSGTSNMPINYIKLQKGTELIDGKGIKHKILPDKYKLIVVEYKGENITMVSMKKTSKMGSTFMNIFTPYSFIKQELKGSLNLYTYYYIERSVSYNPASGTSYGGISKLMENEFVEKDGRLHYIRSLGFKKKMIELCCGCSEVVIKIEEGSYRKNDLYSIVKEYNSECKNLNSLNTGNCNYESGHKLRISVSPVYGTYNMNSMKHFQNELLEDAASSINVPFRISDNFSGYVGYELSLGMNIKSIEYGIQLSSRSTGGRISYSDYSGSYSIDNYLTNKEAAVVFGYQVKNSDKLELVIGGIAGIAITNHTLSSVFQIEGYEEQKELFEFSSLNVFVSPNLKLRYYPVKHIFIETTLRYDLHFGGKQTYDENNEIYLMDRNDKEVTVNWSGLRSGVGLGIRF